MAERRFRPSMDVKDTRSFPLWFGVLGPPLAWAAHLLFSDGVFELGCSPGFVHPDIYGLSLKFWQLLETGLLEAVIVMAGVLSWGALRRLRRMEDGTALGRATGKRVSVKLVIDPSVLGGIVARIGDTVIDGSVRHRLEQLKEKF